MKPQIPSLLRLTLFVLLLLLVPYALAPHAGTAMGYLDNAAEALACPIKSVTITPGSRAIDPGESTTFQVTVSLHPEYKFKGLIVISLTGLPSEVSCPSIEISDSDGDSTAVGTLSINSTCSVTPGPYSLRLDAFARYPNPDSHDQFNGHPTVTFTVNSPTTCFSVDAHEKKTIKAGESTFFTTVVKWCKGYTGDVALSVEKSSLPAGVSYEFDSNPVSPAGNKCNGNAETKLRIHSTSDTPPGVYTIIVKGTSGGVTESDTVTLTVEKPPEKFSLSAGPQTPSDIKPGETATYKIYAHNFFDPVRFSIKMPLPDGIKDVELDPMTLPATSDHNWVTLTVKTDSTIKEGTYNITVKGTCGDQADDVAVKLVVEKPAEKFSLSADSQTPPEIKPGDPAAFKIHAHNFLQPVRFSVKMPLPDGVKDASIDPVVLPVTGTHDWVTLTVKTDSTIKEGTYNITVKGVCGDQTKDVVVTLNVGKTPESATLSVDKSVFPSAAKVGGIVLYTIRIENNGRGALTGVIVRDALPAGVGYVKGTTVINGKKFSDPSGGTTLLWQIGDIAGGETITLKYQGMVKPNIAPGRSTNTVTVTGRDPTGRTLTARDSADIGISSGALERKGKIKGRVFIDENKNGLKNVDEEGVAGIWVILENGERTSSDEEGSFIFDAVDSGEHLVGLDVRKLPKDYYVIGDASKIVSLFSGGTGRTGFALGRTGPSKKELEEMRKAEEKKIEEAARKEEALKKEAEKREAEKRLPKGTISGRVFVDVNANGVYDPRETLVKGITVLLDDKVRVQTDTRGLFTFEKVTAEKHRITLLEDRKFKEAYKKAKKEATVVVVEGGKNHKVDIPLRIVNGLRVRIDLGVR